MFDIPKLYVCMSSVYKMSRRRYKAPHLSQAEVNGRTSERLEAVGADKHVQATFFHALAAEVMRSDVPALAAVQPRIKKHKETAWTAAYQIIGDYLASSKMTMTNNTIQTERRTANDTINLPMLLHIHGKTDVIMQLIRVTAAYRRLSTRQKIAESPLGDVDTDLRDELA